MKLFNFVGSQINAIFGLTPVLTGTPGTAVSNVASHFNGIGQILTEGRVAPEHGEFAMAKLYEAKLAVDAAIAYGWNGGKTNY